jgi:nucleoid-associated protein YgaU
MFDFTSRYAKQEITIYAAPNGREISYVRRRWLPPGESLPVLAELTFQAHDRLDLLTHRTLGDPLQFWRIADANNVLSPFNLEEVGRVLRISVPQP